MLLILCRVEEKQRQLVMNKLQGEKQNKTVELRTLTRNWKRFCLINCHATLLVLSEQSRWIRNARVHSAKAK